MVVNRGQCGAKASLQTALADTFLPAIGISTEIGPSARTFTGGVNLKFALGCSDDADKIGFGHLFTAGYTGALRDMSSFGQISTRATDSR